MSQDKDKNKIDLQKIEKLTANKPKRTALMIVISGLSGLLTGHSTVGLIIMLLALGGVAVSFILNILPGIIASFVFAGFSVALAYREIKYVQESLRQNKKELDENVNKLTLTLIRVLLWHRIIEKKINEINAELAELNKAELEKMPAEKRQRLKSIIQSFKANVENLRKKQNEVLSYLAATSSRMTDNSLKTLLNRLKNFPDLHDLIVTAHLKSDNIRLTPPEINIPKAPNKAFGSFLGKTNILLGGIYSGITLVTGGVTVACLCLGIAAFSLVGWPALVGVIAVGLLVTAGTIAYGKVRKRQEKALKEVISVNQKLMSINNELDREIESVVEQVKKSSETEIANEALLKEHFKELSQKVNQNNIARLNQEEPTELLRSVEESIRALDVLKENVTYNVRLKRNAEATGLLEKINNCLKLATNDKNYLKEQDILEQVNKQKQNHSTIEAAKHFRSSVSNPVGEENIPVEESIKRALLIRALRESIKDNISVLKYLEVHIPEDAPGKPKLLEEIDASLKQATEDVQFLKGLKLGMEPKPDLKRTLPEVKNPGNSEDQNASEIVVNRDPPLTRDQVKSFDVADAKAESSLGIKPSTE
jgi:biopolymer transport protein ExbB/TolQ